MRNTLTDRRREPTSLRLESELDATAISSERDPELAGAIRSLPTRRRLIVFLRYFADLRYGEIAELCGISEGTVAATLTQAHADLRAALAQEVHR